MSAPSHRNASTVAQQGQAMVLGMLLAGIALIAFVRYFSTGQVVAAKARQLHALDAATYSGALIQARALNMMAYINRAHVGHQLALAHLVTLGSWAALGGTQARQLGTGNPPLHLIAMLFGPGHGAAYAAASKAYGLEHLAGSQGGLAQAYSAHDHAIRNVLARVQGDIARELPQTRWAGMQAVLGHNYPGVAPGSSFDLTIDDDNWPGYVQAYSGHGPLRGLVDEVAQMYGFLSARNHTASNPWMVDGRCPASRHQLRRRGDTLLDAQGRWQSIDTESFHALRSNRWIGCYHREYAMGWGWIPSAASQTMDQPHVDDPPDDFSAQDFWRWVQEATDWNIASGNANPLANSKASAARQRWRGGGLPAYIDTAGNVIDRTLQFSVSLRHAGPQDLVVTARSAAETYYQRPEARGDGLRETGNLFHPYWQARLVAHYRSPWLQRLRP
ncbi:hypothetical protein V0R37_14815 [Pollutimonas sp. H1-120]|uniref:hypothetical protein n=1 Tax=Pollutimonas sp. H1-120 TaxID=3148824 RepID=UPI003B52864F